MDPIMVLPGTKRVILEPKKGSSKGSLMGTAKYLF
jgi:hypothetical protein